MKLALLFTGTNYIRFRPFWRQDAERKSARGKKPGIKELWFDIARLAG
jgi:hypothetical protein